MRTPRKLAVAGAAALALAAGGVGVAVATGDDDRDGAERPISGAALERASDAALEHVGEGHVTETEAGDEDSWYEVEVTRPDGSRVDVQLDRRFAVVDSEDEPGDDD